LLKWEYLESEPGLFAVFVMRAKVHGGWLVYVSRGDGNEAGMTFLPDPSHEWNGASPGEFDPKFPFAAQ
jgi:hypothetical protein